MSDFRHKEGRNGTFVVCDRFRAATRPSLTGTEAMTINATQFRRLVIEPTLTVVTQLAGVPSPPYMHDLLIATAAQETALGKWLHQVRGPALGIYQVEPATLDDLMRNFLSNKRYTPLLDALRCPLWSVEDQLVCDLRFATAVSRLYYWRVPEALPTETTFASLWHYYKSYYNTPLGRADEDDFQRALLLTDFAHRV